MTVTLSDTQIAWLLEHEIEATRIDEDLWFRAQRPGGDLILAPIEPGKSYQVFRGDEVLGTFPTLRGALGAVARGEL